MRPADTSDLWWRSAVFYCLDVETFQDSDGDGVGDLEGLASRIDYLADLGVTCLWLMPFQPTPDRDDGYDISDFYGVDRRAGDLGHFVELLRVAHGRGIRVIMDLVLNHTSDRHPWFVSARRSRTSRYRDYYVWRDHRPPQEPPAVFPGEETSCWEKDERTGQYYLHNFYRGQPDLNLANPQVRAEIARIIGFWTQLGVDGFRVDAVPFLIQPPGAADENDPHAFLRELHRFVGRRSGDAALLGEVGLSLTEQAEYFGREEAQLDLQFDFETAQSLFLALARGQAAPLVRAMRRRPHIDAREGWVTFLRHHDELNLGMLSDREREEVFDTFAPDDRQRVFGRGIVRRLSPMLRGDPRRLRHAYSLLFSLPGAPLLLYGEEIGMGELEGRSDRKAVRTPMQWRRGRNGGFSTAPPSKLIREIPGGGYAPQHVNVHDQLRSPDSLLSFVKTLIARYRAAPEIAWGELTLHDVGDPQVLVHSLRDESRTFIAVHGFGDEARRVALPDEIAGDEHLIDLLQPIPPVRPEHGVFDLELDGWGYRWFRVGSED